MDTQQDRRKEEARNEETEKQAGRERGEIAEQQDGTTASARAMAANLAPVAVLEARKEDRGEWDERMKMRDE